MQLDIPCNWIFQKNACFKKLTIVSILKNNMNGLNFLFAFMAYGIAAANSDPSSVMEEPGKTGTFDPQNLAVLIADSVDPADFESETAYEAYIEELMELFPIDLNTATKENLILVPGISIKLVNSILEHRPKNGFSTSEDLLSIPGIGPITLSRINPWVTVNQRGSRGRLRSSGLNALHYLRFQQSFPVSTGYRSKDGEPPTYPGSPSRLYHRQAIITDRVTANLTQVKLPGEPVRKPQGADFTSANLQITGLGPIKQLVTGDYTLRFGQGLVVWSAASFGKGGPAHNAPYRRARGITPYQSSGQIRFFRGAATDISLRKEKKNSSAPARTELLLTAFYSKRNKSAVELDGDTIRPPSSNPYHRTDTERSRRHNTREFVHGANLLIRNNEWSLGATYFSFELDRPVIPHPQSSPCQGSTNQSLGTYFDAQKGRLKLFGEYAAGISNCGSHKNMQQQSPLTSRSAWIAGLSGEMTENLDWIFSLRSFGRDYWSEYGNGFGEGSGVPANQKGWYMGFRVRPTSRLMIQSFLDRFVFPAPRRGHTRSSSGYETMLHATYRSGPRRNLQLRIRYKNTYAEFENHDDWNRSYRISGRYARLSIRLQENRQVHSRLFIRPQIDWIQTGSTDDNKKSGFAISKAIRWQVFRTLRLDGNMSFFETDDFTSRLYLHEYDLTHVMGSRMVYGVGRTSGIVARYNPVHWLVAEGVYKRIRYADRPAVGSGNDLTVGPVRSYMGLQLRIRY